MEAATPTGTLYKSLSLTSSAGKAVLPGLAGSPASGTPRVTRQQAGVIWGFASLGSHKLVLGVGGALTFEDNKPDHYFQHSVIICLCYLPQEPSTSPPHLSPVRGRSWLSPTLHSMCPAPESLVLGPLCD